MKLNIGLVGIAIIVIIKSFEKQGVAMAIELVYGIITILIAYSCLIEKNETTLKFSPLIALICTVIDFMVVGSLGVGILMFSIAQTDNKGNENIGIGFTIIVAVLAVVTKTNSYMEILCLLGVIISTKLLGEQLKTTEELLKDANHNNSKLTHSNIVLNEKSTRDKLTGVYNRANFDEYIKETWNKAAAKNKNIGMLMIDIDYFKKYNDGYGHQQGDECLKKVAKAIHDKTRRGNERAFRYGGEEFAVVIYNTNIEETSLIAEIIHKSVIDCNIEHNFSDVSNQVTISIGGYVSNEKSCGDIKTLIQKADENLYKAKESGRNKYIIR